MGREVGAEKPPIPPRENRHGIPDLGKCIRCNLQIEGSGVNADDVIIEAGDASKGDGGPNGVGTVKDVAIRADRADGFVLQERQGPPRQGARHLRARVRRLPAHALQGLLQRPLRDADLRRGPRRHSSTATRSATATRASTRAPPSRPATSGPRARSTGYNQEVRFCDLHHNMAGYSGTNGNAVWVHDNRIYDNALGLQTDVVTGAGHPGYPGDSMIVENNRFFSNNFNVYEEDSSVNPAFPFPVGTGMWIAGGNSPPGPQQPLLRQLAPRDDALQRPRPARLRQRPPDGNQQAGCDPNGQTTSFNNSHFNNKMGMRPDGTRRPERRRTSGGTRTRARPATAGGTTSPAPGARDHRLVAAARCPSARRARSASRASARATPRRPASC